MPYPDPSDDEIVYLGTGRTGQVPSHPPALRPVTGAISAPSSLLEPWP